MLRFRQFSEFTKHDAKVHSRLREVGLQSNRLGIMSSGAREITLEKQRVTEAVVGFRQIRFQTPICVVQANGFTEMMGSFFELPGSEQGVAEIAVRAWK